MKKPILYKELGAGQGIAVSREGPYEGKLSYPLVEVPSLKASLSSRPGRPYPRCYLDVEATLKVRDAIDDERFLYDVAFPDVVSGLAEYQSVDFDPSACNQLVRLTATGLSGNCDVFVNSVYFWCVNECTLHTYRFVSTEEEHIATADELVCSRRRLTQGTSR